MLKPARMTRILVGGHQDHMEEVIETMYGADVVHLEDYRDPSLVTSMGTPLEAGDEVSDLLVRVRGLQKALDLPALPPRKMAVDEAARPVEEAEEALQPALHRQNDARARVAALETEQQALEPLRSLDIDASAIRSTTALRTYVGTVREDPAGPLAAAGIEHDLSLQRSGAGLVALLLVRPDDAVAAERALAEAGFSAIQVPEVKGTPEQALAALEVDLADARAERDDAEQQVTALADKWGGRLASLEHHFAAEAAKTSAPLSFGVTDQTFHVEGWVPVGRLNHLRNVLASGFGESLYLEDLGDAPREARGHAASHVGATGPDHTAGHDDHEVDVDDEAPTQLKNKGPSRAYEFLLSLLATPRYRELDPTKLIAIFFPLFFGLMVGDLAIGLLIMIIALWLRKNSLFGIGGPGVAKPMFWGGLWAAVIGALVFGEALGLHFVLSDEALEAGEHSWESVLGAHFPETGFIHKEGGHAVAEAHAAPQDSLDEAYVASDDHSPGAITPHAEGTSEEGGALSLFAPHGGAHLSVGGWFNLGYYSKIHDVEALLLWSVVIGITHLVLGFILGVRNIYASHGLKLAIQEKVSWLLIMASVPLIVLGMQNGVPAMQWGGLALFLVSVALLWMGVQHTIGVGFIAILEIPSLLGNILSYTRLAAIGASKAGMAIAFATIGFELIGGPAGWIVYLLASLLITVLAILAGFLQSLRLQFVEFFSKFYEGGGRRYTPFGRSS